MAAPTELLESCRHSFREEEYGISFDRAVSILPKGAPLDILQVLLISLQRSGREQELERYKKKLLAATSKHPWLNSLLRLTVDETTLADLLEMAESPSRTCQARYYAGERHLTLGQDDAARLEFVEASAVESKCVERDFALKALKRLEIVAEATMHTAIDEEEPPSETNSTVDAVEATQEEAPCAEAYQAPADEEAQREPDPAPESQTKDDARESGDGVAEFLRLAEEKLSRGRLLETRALCERHESDPLWEDASPLEKSRWVSGKARALFGLGEQESALAILRERRDELTDADGESEAHLVILNALGDLLIEQAADEALSVLTEAKSLADRLFGDEHEAYRERVFATARLQEAQEVYTRARPVYQLVVDGIRTKQGEENVPYVEALRRIGALFLKMGDVGRARRDCERAEEIAGRVLEPDHPIQLRLQHVLAEIDAKEDDVDAAMDRLRRGIEKSKELDGHILDRATALDSLARWSLDRGDLDGSEKALCESLKLKRDGVGASHSSLHASFTLLSKVYDSRGLNAAADYLARCAHP